MFSSARQFPKTGGFRRKATVAQWQHLQELLGMLAVDMPVRSRSSSPPPTAGFPTVFKEHRRQK